MDPKAALAELEKLAEQLGVELTYDNFTGDGARAGGLCKLRGRWRVIIERRTSPGERVSVLSQALAKLCPEDLEVSDEIRALLDARRERAA